MAIDDRTKVVLIIFGLLLVWLLIGPLQIWLNENLDTIKLLFAFLIGFIVCLLWLRRPQKKRFVDPKLASIWFFTKTRFGKDIAQRFIRVSFDSGNEPIFNIGTCSSYCRDDGIGGIFGEMFMPGKYHYLVLDLTKEHVADNDTNYVAFGTGIMSTKDFEKEVERLRPAEKTPYEKAVEKKAKEVMERKAEDIAEEVL